IYALRVSNADQVVFHAHDRDSFFGIAAPATGSQCLDLHRVDVHADRHRDDRAQKTKNASIIRSTNSAWSLVAGRWSSVVCGHGLRTSNDYRLTTKPLRVPAATPQLPLHPETTTGASNQSAIAGTMIGSLGS